MLATKSSFRLLLAVNLVSWFVGIWANLGYVDYQVSRYLADMPWAFFQMTSIVGLVLYLVSIGGLTVLAKWAPPTYSVHLLYVIVYSLVFGEGWGSRFATFLNVVFLISSGMILCAVTNSPISELFGRKASTGLDRPP